MISEKMTDKQKDSYNAGFEFAYDNCDECDFKGVCSDVIIAKGDYDKEMFQMGFILARKLQKYIIENGEE